MTESRGTKIAPPSEGERTERSTVSENVKVARKIARVTWTNRSWVKVRSSRGENWLLASWSVTTVRENVSDVTVISELATALSTVRAAPGSPLKIRVFSSPDRCASRRTSSSGTRIPAATARTTPRMGSGHSWVRTPSCTVCTARRRERFTRSGPSWSGSRSGDRIGTWGRVASPRAGGSGRRRRVRSGRGAGPARWAGAGRCRRRSGRA